MDYPWIFVILVAVVFLFVAPQLSKFRSITGIDAKLASGDLTILQKSLYTMLGLKTPLLHTLTVLFTFITTESDKLIGFGWDQFISKEHAALVTAALWMATLWAHFSGLNTAAAMPPVPAAPNLQKL